MLEIGQKVKYKASFLKSIGWYTDVPRYGIVHEIYIDRRFPSPYRLKVKWEGSEEVTGVLSSNVQSFDKPDYSGL